MWHIEYLEEGNRVRWRRSDWAGDEFELCDNVDWVMLEGVFYKLGIRTIKVEEE